jgi:hypothetical protein
MEQTRPPRIFIKDLQTGSIVIALLFQEGVGFNIFLWKVIEIHEKHLHVCRCALNDLIRYSNVVWRRYFTPAENLTDDVGLYICPDDIASELRFKDDYRDMPILPEWREQQMREDCEA